VSNLNFDLISRYRVLRPLGPTQLGHVYLSISNEERSKALAASEESRSPGFFCLEVLHPDWAKDADLRALFLEEAAQTLELEHPNVVRSQELIDQPEACARVTRWFAGHSLARLLERMGREAFPLHLHVRVLCEVLSALQYLHEIDDPTGASGGIVYRDASPQRVLLTYTGQVKLLGAGFERTIDEIERHSGHLLADIGYAAPELCLGYPASPAGDVYSVGVMLWEALARAPRKFADSAEASLHLRISGEEPDIDQFRPGVPRRLAEICRRALAVSPRERYASAQELQIDLESYLADTETDAQQNAGLGALAQLMMQHFADERAEMLTWIEQQLASRHGADPSQERLAGKPARPCVPPPPSSPVQPDARDGDEGDVSEPFNLQPLWDDRTHTVTSFEEVGEANPAPALEQRADSGAEPLSESANDEQPSYNQDPRYTAEREGSDPPAAAEQEALCAEPEPPLPVLEHDLPLREHVRPAPRPGLPPPFLIREPDTSGHRAYSSTLQPTTSAAGQLSRFALPVALAAGVLLLVVAQVVRSARREPAQLGGVAAVAPAPRAPRPEPAPTPQPAREVLAVRAGAGVAPVAEEKTREEQVEAAPAEPSLSEATPAPAAPAIAPAPEEPNAAPVAEPPASPASTAGEDSPPFGIEAILPTLSADEPQAAPAPRATAKSRRGKRPDPHAARALAPLPRSIDETDPYLE
jgi:serine/threonine protein kinase